MTTIKINIFDDILTQVTKKNNTQVTKIKTLHWRESQDVNLPGVKNKNVYQTERAFQGNKKG